MAEGLLRYKGLETERDDLIVSSMGISGLDNVPATQFAQTVCKEQGFDISPHRSRPLMGEELRAADLILCMEPVHRKFLRTFYPWNKDKVFLLGAWPEKETRKSPIHDPMGGPLKIFRRIYGIIETHIDRILSLL